MPQAWLARFGRTVADQVLDAVHGRLAAARVPGVEVSVAGQRLGGAAAAELEKREAEARLDALSEWLRGEADEERAGLESREVPLAARAREVTTRELLTGSSFARTGGTPEGGFGALWGRGTVTRRPGRTWT